MLVTAALTSECTWTQKQNHDGNSSINSKKKSTWAQKQNHDGNTNSSINLRTKISEPRSQWQQFGNTTPSLTFKDSVGDISVRCSYFIKQTKGVQLNQKQTSAWCRAVAHAQWIKSTPPDTAPVLPPTSSPSPYCPPSPSETAVPHKTGCHGFGSTPNQIHLSTKW